MPSAFSHAISAIALGSAFKNTNDRIRMTILGVICSVLPDADVLSFHFGVSYSSMWGHRGFSHSIFFALLLAMVIMKFFYRQMNDSSKWFRLYIYFFLSTVLHPLLDACTDGGLGVALFSPFINERYFFSFRPIEVSPISVSGFFTQRGWEVFKSELFWVWLPSAIIFISSFLFSKAFRVKNLKG